MRNIGDVIRDALYLVKTHEKSFCYWHYEANSQDFAYVMDQLGNVLTAMSNVNLHTEVVINNNPSWCTSGNIIDICLVGKMEAKLFFESHRDMFGL